MIKNMGTFDRVIRLILAAIFVILNITGVATGALSVILWIVAGIFTLTSLVSTCPLYIPLKVSTLGKNKGKE